jgi:(2Fe-2S) ferredoxin
MSYFKHHVFFCTNQRPEGDNCCNNLGATSMHKYAKERVRELGLDGPGKIRTNKAGCLDRCAQGPVLVIYPDNVWYQYVDQQDVEEIIQEHLVNGRVVDRLKI